MVSCDSFLAWPLEQNRILNQVPHAMNFDGTIRAYGIAQTGETVSHVDRSRRPRSGESPLIRWAKESLRIAGMDSRQAQQTRCSILSVRFALISITLIRAREYPCFSRQELYVEYNSAMGKNAHLLHFLLRVQSACVVRGTFLRPSRDMSVNPILCARRPHIHGLALVNANKGKNEK